MSLTSKYGFIIKRNVQLPFLQKSRFTTLQIGFVFEQSPVIRFWHYFLKIQPIAFYYPLQLGTRDYCSML